jgi:NADPH:quinone reductase-like Zn-dependent oxidoreductase
MIQAWLTESGTPPGFTLREAPDPVPGNGEVRIRVEACGVSAADLPHGGSPTPPLPYVPGYEVAGTVDAVGQGVAHVPEGAQVFALLPGAGYADTVCVNHKRVFQRLQWMSARDAAALPTDFLTAYQALRVMGSLRAGNQVLLTDADDALGVALLEICRLFEAKALVTAPMERHDLLKEKGAAHAIDPSRVDLAAAIEEATGSVALDLVVLRNQAAWRAHYPLLGPTGRLLCLPGARRRWQWLARLRPALTTEQLLRDNRGLLGVQLAPDFPDVDRQRQWMETIVDWYDEARFRPTIDRTFPLDAAAAAHAYLAEPEGLGKVLLLP